MIFNTHVQTLAEMKPPDAQLPHLHSQQLFHILCSAIDLASNCTRNCLWSSTYTRWWRPVFYIFVICDRFVVVSDKK